MPWPGFDYKSLFIYFQLIYAELNILKLISEFKYVLL